MDGLLGNCGLLLMLLFSSVQNVKADIPEDCTQIKKQVPHAPSGIYNIQPVGRSFPFKVYCEMRPDGGWTVFQRRSGGSVSFNREWIDYKSGFGSLSDDHWLGLEQVFLMTNSRAKSWTLRVDLWDFEGGTAYAEYKNFKLGNEQTAYKLQVGPYVGTAGDAIRGVYPDTDENGFGFTTIHRDNDGCNPCLIEGDIAIFSCVQIKSGAWWFSKCGSAALNGEWQPDGDNIDSSSGLHWFTWKFPQQYSAKATRMMIKSE